jgi:phytoene dehydrogenase-like protein
MHDLLVIGAGFGGLGAALSACEAGADVVLCETLNYPGGCASTFTRDGYRFESGATLFSGLAEGQLFGRWKAQHGLDYEVDFLDPVVTLRSDTFTLAVPRRREELVARLVALCPGQEAGVRAFMARQERVADVLWELFDRPELLPPLDARALAHHAGRAHRYAQLLPLLGKSLGAVLASHGLDSAHALRVFVRAACQITVQCPAELAEAPFALGALDYFFRGTGHVRGGIGELAWALVRAFQRLGGELQLSTRVKSLARVGDHYRAITRRGPIEARRVIVNLVPAALRGLAPELASARLERLETRVDRGYGAVMLYRAIADHPGLPDEPHHLELVDDSRAAFVEGNHVFVSLGGRHEHGRAPAGQRTLTASTHLAIDALRAVPAREQGPHVAAIQERMRATIQKRAPELGEPLHELPGSPRTFARFTGRPEGLVGGIPRLAGLAHYRELGPCELAPRLFMVGDSVFPGQSTLATALGGARTAKAALDRA